MAGGGAPRRDGAEAQKLTGDPTAHARVVKEMLLRNFELCQRSAVFTPDNLARMKLGHSALVTSGTYAGQTYDVDHIIPVHEFPALARELANLIYLPAHLNRSKGADIQQRALDLGTRLAAAGVLTPADVQRIHDIRHWGESRSPLSAGTVPSTSPASQPAAPPASVSPASGKVNLNTASSSAIETLPGIGPKTAAKIIAARPLKNLAALDNVPGIGAKTLERLKELVSF